MEHKLSAPATVDSSFTDLQKCEKAPVELVTISHYLHVCSVVSLQAHSPTQQRPNEMITRHTHDTRVICHGGHLVFIVTEELTAMPPKLF